MLTRLGADFAMLVHLGMTLTFGRAGSCEGDAGGQLRFKELPVANLVGARENAACRGTDRGAIVVEADACDQPTDVLLGETGVGTGRARFDAGKASLDAAADGVGMAWLLRMSVEHVSDGNSGHGGNLPSGRACPTTRAALLGSGRRKVPPGLQKLVPHACGSTLEFKRCH